MELDHDAELSVGDMHSFWFYAGSWMLRVSLLVAAFKLVGTLSWASLRGYGASLDFWFGVVPHFDIALSEDRFVRLVTLSTWLGIVGAIVGLAWAFSQARRIATLHGAYRTWVAENYADQVAEEAAALESADAKTPADPSHATLADAPTEEELVRFDRFTEQVARRGVWLGAWLGALTLLVTIAFEMMRHLLGDAYVWQVQHLIATCIALIPVIALLAMVLAGRFRAVLAVRDVGVLLSAAGIVIHRDPVAATERSPDADHETNDRSPTDGRPSPEANPSATPVTAALGS